jgi:hypothetical protein
LPDHQYLIGASPAALRATSSELTDAWLGLVERAHADPADRERA